MNTLVVKRSIVLNGLKTSISLEEQFWDAFGEIAASQNLSRSQLISKIAQNRSNTNLSSAIRVFTLLHFQAREAREKTLLAPPTNLLTSRLAIDNAAKSRENR